MFVKQLNAAVNSSGKQNESETAFFSYREYRRWYGYSLLLLFRLVHTNPLLYGYLYLRDMIRNATDNSLQLYL